MIVAMDKNDGIGYQGKLPWYNKDELSIFKEKTIGKILFVGRKTMDLLPHLPDRKVICITHSDKDYNNWNNPPEYIKNIKDINNFPEKLCIIAGGRQLYEQTLSIPGYITKIHISIMDESYICDTFFDRLWIQNYVICDEIKKNGFTHYILEYSPYGEGQYLSILRKLVEHNTWRQSRNAVTCSMFKNDMSFDLRNGFPLLTTKKMFLRGIVEEFIFFINGKTNTKELEEKGVNIWKGNTTREFLDSKGLPYTEGVMGPMYGYQFRYYNAPYFLTSKKTTFPPIGGIDQLANVVKLIQKDPNSRRILMTAYNPSQAELGVLYPCHSITLQFYVEDKYLDMFCYNRSQDFVLGTSFNIASSSLLLMMVAKLTDKIPRFFHLTMGDTHLYEQHLEGAHEILNRIPYKFPTLEFPNVKNLDDLPSLKAEQFVLKDYRHHSVVKVPMIA